MVKDLSEKKKAFEEVFKRNYKPLLYRALDRIDDEEVAKDIVGGLFADIWQDFDNVRLEGVDVYLRRILHNRCINHLQHQTVERKYQDYYLNVKGSILEEPDDLHEERMQIVNSVIDSLPPQRRFIFEQCVIEGKSYKEVAEIVSLQVSSIHKHISKTYAMLREALLPK